ncbi:MAG TPA: hypothetical protein VII63_11810 [Caulobacteraceae bacterium]
MLASPDGERVARVSPWDAAYRLHAELCRHSNNPYLQRVDAILPLGVCGHVVVMERLFSAREDRAAAFCVALGLANDVDWAPPANCDASAFAGQDLAALRTLIGTLAAEGAASVPFWGGLDVRPGNVMADAAGQLKLVDPVFVAGRKIAAAILARDRQKLARLPPGALEAFLTIPACVGRAEDLRTVLIDLGLIGRTA